MWGLVLRGRMQGDRGVSALVPLHLHLVGVTRLAGRWIFQGEAVPLRA